jgi:hypothetical protein
MRFFEFKQTPIKESQGGIFRRAQEVEQGAEVRFKNAQNNQEIKLQSAEVFPQEGEYQTYEELDQQITAFLAMFEVAAEDVQYSGKPETSRAALVSVWTDLATGTPLAFIKLAKKKGEGAAPILQTNADFKKDFGYGAQNKTAQRATVKLKPTDILQSDTWLSVDGVIDSVKSVVQNRSDLDTVFKEGVYTMLENVTNGSTTPAPGMGKYQSSLEIDLGETAAPLALITGNFVGGDYIKAEQYLLKPLDLTWSDLAEVLFPSAGNEHIYDSYIKLDETSRLKISSKDKKGGAAASITGLVAEVTKNPEKFADVLRNKKFAEVFKLLKIVANPENRYWTRSNKGINGPLILGVDHYQLITDEDAKLIVKLIQSKDRTPPAQALEQGTISQTLYDLTSAKGAKFEDPSYNLGSHLLAALAKTIANQANKDPSTGNLFRALLERSNMIQIKTTVKTTKLKDMEDGAAFTNFTVVYPPIFTGQFLMEADNNYMATRLPIGPLSFKIK